MGPFNCACRTKTGLGSAYCHTVISQCHAEGMGGEFRVAEVVIQEGESLENALRRFKRKVQQEDIIKEIKKHSFYMKPGEKRRTKQALSRKRLRKKQRREQD
jgi:small subunit ribosomal protein S21